MTNEPTTFRGWYILRFPTRSWPQYDVIGPMASEEQAKEYPFAFTSYRYIIMEASNKEGIRAMIESQIEACQALFDKDAEEVFFRVGE